MTRLLPIPALDTDVDVNAVQVVECGEEIISIQSEERIWVQPAYYALGYKTATNILRLRRNTVEALRRAVRDLPDGMSVILWDGLRTLDTQLEITNRFRETISLAISNACERERLIKQYISPLPTSEAEFSSGPPPHSTGGAVDLTLGNDQGQSLDLGAEFDQFDEVAAVTHYEYGINRFGFSGLDKTRCEMRRILYWSMTRAGFAPYPFEYWHFEYGTRRMAAFHGRTTAPYGPAVPFRGLSQ